jgi:hypothetical protein
MRLSARRRVRDDTPLRARAGYLLVEALCALALAGLLAAASAATLHATRRATDAADRRFASARTGREAVAIIGAMLRDADTLVLRNDTSVTFVHRIAAGPVCATESRALWLPPAAGVTGVPLTARAQPIETSDRLEVLLRDPAGAPLSWSVLTVDSVSERVTAPGCGIPDGWIHPADDAVPRVRLAVREGVPAGVLAGAPLRVGRWGRLRLYRDGTGAWMLGWQRCAAEGSTCGPVQPVAGPLESPARGGLRIRAGGAGMLDLEARGRGSAAVARSQVVRRAAP